MILIDSKKKEVDIEGSVEEVMAEFGILTSMLRENGIPEVVIKGALNIGLKSYDKFHEGEE